MKSSKHHQTRWETNIPNHFHFQEKATLSTATRREKKTCESPGRLRVLIVTQKKISPLLPNTFFI